MKPEKKMKEPDGGDGHTEGLGFYLLYFVPFLQFGHSFHKVKFCSGFKVHLRPWQTGSQRETVTTTQTEEIIKANTVMS